MEPIYNVGIKFQVCPSSRGVKAEADYRQRLPVWREEGIAKSLSYRLGHISVGLLAKNTTSGKNQIYIRLVLHNKIKYVKRFYQTPIYF